jgi:hypothetical protein
MTFYWSLARTINDWYALFVKRSYLSLVRNISLVCSGDHIYKDEEELEGRKGNGVKT